MVIETCSHSTIPATSGGFPFLRRRRQQENLLCRILLSTSQITKMYNTNLQTRSFFPPSSGNIPAMKKPSGHRSPLALSPRSGTNHPRNEETVGTVAMWIEFDVHPFRLQSILLCYAGRIEHLKFRMRVEKLPNDILIFLPDE